MKKLLSIIFSSLLLLSFILISCEPEDLGTATIYGIVTDKASGEPIQKAGVELLPSGLKTITGTDGRFEFTNLMAGSYSLSITQKGYNDVNAVNVELSMGQSLQRDVQMELIPPALKVVDEDNKDLSVLDFGSAEADIARAFNIFNDGTEKLEWEVTKTAFWIDSISKTSGALYSNNKQPIVVFIDRNKLEEGENKTTLQVTSTNGSKSITIKAENKREAIVINMLECSDITGTTAVFNAEMINEGNPKYTERGFVYSTNPMPTVDNTIFKFTAPVDENVKFSSQANKLETDVTYYVRAYAINALGLVYSANQVSFVVNTSYPTVKTNNVTAHNIFNGTAIFNGEIILGGDPVYTERGFVYGLVPNPTIDDTKKVVSGSGKGAFSANISGLEEGKVYYIRAFATNAKGTAYGADVKLDCTASKPILTTNEVTNIKISDGTATFVGNVESYGDLPCIERGFVYATVNNPTIHDTKFVVSGNETGIFRKNVTNLEEGHTYYVRAYITNQKETIYGNVVTCNYVATMPVVQTNEVLSKNLAEGTASFSGTIVSEGDLPYTERGFVYATTHNPTIDDIKVTALGTGLGDFTSQATGLIEGKTFYVRAFVTNSKGTVYGEEVSLDFTAIMPTIKTNGVVSKNIAKGTASFSGTIVTEGDLPYTERGFVYSTAHNPTINDSKVISIGSGVGDFISIATELQEGKVYYIRSFVTNFKETIYGEEISLDFTAKNPIVKTNLVLNKNIAEGTATFSGTIESEGDLPYIERGFVYSTAHNPNIYDTKVLAQGSGLGEFTVSVKNLLEGQTFYVRSFVSNKKGTFYGDEVTLDFIAVMPRIKTNGVISKDIGGRTASFSGTIISIGDLPYIEYGFVYSVSHNPTISDKKVVASGSGLGDFTANASEIIEGSIYYVRAYLTNKKGTVYGEEVMMDFQPIKPIVVTLPITNKNISQGTVTLNGNISNIGDPAYIKKGFEFHSPLMVTILEVDGRNTGNFSYNLSNVSVGSSYYYRAFAKTKNETVYGERVEFDFYAILPEVETVSIIAQSANSVYMVGNIKVGGNPMFHECGFIYGNISNPTIEDTSVTKIMVSNTISGQFEKQVSIALGTSTWYVRAYAKSSAGVSYGEIIKVSDPEYEDYVKLPKVSVEEKVLTSYINVVYRISHEMGIMTWESAATTCENLVYNGFDDWELPSKSVLQQMYNEKSKINDLYDDYYWGIDSQLKPQGNGSYVPVKARYFSFKSGETGYSELNNQYRVRCVRKE